MFLADVETSRCDDVAWKKWKPFKNISKTFSGGTCQNWNNLSIPESHNLKTRFPNIVMTDEIYNFCQDLDSSGVSWCYTPESVQHLWEPCFIQCEFCI